MKLIEMSQKEFDAYYPGALKHLAEELSLARDISHDEALDLARKSFDSLLPNGDVKAPDQFLYTLHADGIKVGVLHFGIRRDRKAPYVYIWDIIIDQDQRGKGFGKQVMQAIEEQVIKLGHSRIALNVFGHNTPAVSLYKKMGYQPSSITMVKVILQ